MVMKVQIGSEKSFWLKVLTVLETVFLITCMCAGCSPTVREEGESGVDDAPPNGLRRI